MSVSVFQRFTYQLNVGEMPRNSLPNARSNGQQCSSQNVFGGNTSNNEIAMSEGNFEGYGGRHVPEPLREPLEQLAGAYDEVGNTDKFQNEFRDLLEEYAGRPTPLYYARNSANATTPKSP